MNIPRTRLKTKEFSLTFPHLIHTPSALYFFSNTMTAYLKVPFAYPFLMLWKARKKEMKSRPWANANAQREGDVTNSREMSLMNDEPNIRRRWDVVSLYQAQPTSTLRHGSWKAKSTKKSSRGKMNIPSLSHLLTNIHHLSSWFLNAQPGLFRHSNIVIHRVQWGKEHPIFDWADILIE